jgi:hypothetical protein
VGSTSALPPAEPRELRPDSPALVEGGTRYPGDLLDVPFRIGEVDRRGFTRFVGPHGRCARWSASPVLPARRGSRETCEEAARGDVEAVAVDELERGHARIVEEFIPLDLAQPPRLVSGAHVVGSCRGRRLAVPRVRSTDWALKRSDGQKCLLVGNADIPYNASGGDRFRTWARLLWPSEAEAGVPCACRPAYQAQAYSPREGRTIRKTFASLSEARAWRQETQVALRRRTLRAPTRTTLSEAAAEWLATARRQGATRRARSIPILPLRAIRPIGSRQRR